MRRRCGRWCGIGLLFDLYELRYANGCALYQQRALLRRSAHATRAPARFAVSMKGADRSKFAIKLVAYYAVFYWAKGLKCQVDSRGYQITKPNLADI
jgi:hypothetical protein